MRNKKSLEKSLEKYGFSPIQRIALLLCNYIPFAHIAVIICSIAIPWTWLRWRFCAAAAILYLAPPLLCRCALILSPIKEERIPIPSRAYFTWWFTLNLQILFCRLPFLEEVMRIIPGAYSLWLRLWGSRIGAFTYWAPELRILDRGFLEIGDGVAFGAGVRLNPHVIARNDDGKLELILASVRIGDAALIGGYSLLTAGTVVAENETTKARLLSPPFSHWRNGKRVQSSMKNAKTAPEGQNDDN